MTILNVPYRLSDTKQEYGKDIPQTKKIKSALEEWLTSNVVEPAANAGYPNLGAAAATVPSTIAEFLLPENTSEFAPGMAGVRKTSRKADKFVKELQEAYSSGKINKNTIDEIYKDISNKVNSLYKFLNATPDINSQAIKSYVEEINKLEGNVSKLNKLYDAMGTDYLKKEQIKKGLSSKIFKDWDNIDVKDNISHGLPVSHINENIKHYSDEIQKIRDIVLGSREGQTYLRPKGYAKQKSTKIPQQEFKSMPSRNEYDKMLRGENPGQKYFDEMSEGYRKFIQDQEDEIDPAQKFIRKSWKGE